MKILPGLFLMLTASTASAETAADWMRAYTWQNRVLLLFAPRADDARLARQARILAAVPPGLAERDLVVVRAHPGEKVSVDGESRALDGDALYRHFGVAGDAFRVILVGKDGGVKLDRAEPVAATALFALIDAMPMRRREMRESGG